MSSADLTLKRMRFPKHNPFISDKSFVQVGEESSFIDLWLDAEQGKQVEGEGIRQGSLVQVDVLVPVNVGEEDDVVIRFVSGGNMKRLLGEEARSLATTIDERKSESQLNMTSVQAVINMVDMDGTFEYQSQQVSEFADSIQENPPSRMLPPLTNVPVPQVGESTVLREEDRTVDVSLSPWDPSQTNQKKVSQQGRTDEIVALSNNSYDADQSSSKRRSANPDPPNADNPSSGIDLVEDVLNSLPAEEEEEFFSLEEEEGSSQGSASLLEESQVVV